MIAFFIIQSILIVALFILHDSNKTQIFSQNKQIQSIMATQANFQEQMDRLNAATSVLAQKLTDLQGQIEGGGLLSEVENSVLAQLKGVADTLEAMGKTPEEPTEA